MCDHDRVCADVCVSYCVPLYVSFCRLWVAMYYEYVCCIDEDIWRFHMGVSRSILQSPVDVFFFLFSLCPPVGFVVAAGLINLILINPVQALLLLP